MRHHLNHIVFIRRLRQVARKTLVAVLGERLACKFIDLLYRILEGAGAVVLKAVVPARQFLKRLPYKPVFSVIVVLKSSPPELKHAVKSVMKQIYPLWELIVVSTEEQCDDVRKSPPLPFDKRIKPFRISKSDFCRGRLCDILKDVRGDYVLLLDGSERLNKTALFSVAEFLNQHPDADLVYSDEEEFTGSGTKSSNIRRKPHWSPDLLLSVNYIGSTFFCRTGILSRVSAVNQSLSLESHPYDLLLHITEQTGRVYHFPMVTFHRYRSDPFVMNRPARVSEMKRVLEAAVGRRKIDAVIIQDGAPGTFYVKRRFSGRPLVSVLIPFKNKPDLLEMCLDAILSRSTYSSYEIVGISNNSTDPDVYRIMSRFEKRDSRVRFIEYDIPFNYSKINNYAVSRAGGEHLVLLNNDVEIITPDWLQALLEHSCRPEVGAVGAMLYYPNGTIQHAGTVLGFNGLFGHLYSGCPGGFSCKKGFPFLVQNIIAVTGACMMIKKSLYARLGGLDEIHLPVSYNDVDLCLRLHEAGFMNILTPYCEAYHYESISRGCDSRKEYRARAESEAGYMMRRHAKFFAAGDPYYSKMFIEYVMNHAFAGDGSCVAQ